MDVTLMEPSTLLRKTVAEFFEVDEGQVGSSFSLQTRQGSIARAALDAAIRGRVGVKSVAVYSAKTFGELEAEIAPGATSSPSTVAAAPSTIAISQPIGGGSGASCGVDLELIANLPSSIDPWEDPFYQANFSPSEIAYCLRQLDPPTHFAARWCAKEALKKCDRAFLAVEPKEIEVVLDEAGAPRLEYRDGGTSKRLPHAVSLSHTSLAAIAVVVRVEPPSVPAPVPMVPVSPTLPAPLPRRPSKVLVVLNLVAIVLASLALARTFSFWRWPFSG
jgi:phosphopantetheine--protein transferase-like protein